MERCWILLGMMGSGKTTVGKLLAERSGREFVDTDQLLKSRFGRPVHRIFAVYGEDAFRDHETSVLRQLEPRASVLATGGGTVLREENWTELRRLGLTIFLKTDPQKLRERLSQSRKRRPLLEVENWEERLLDLLEFRRSLYERADLVFDVSNLPLEEAAERLHAAIDAHESGGCAAQRGEA